MSAQSAAAGVRPGRRRPRSRPAPARAHPAGEGAAPGPPRAVAAPAVPRAPPALGQERRRRRGHDARLPPRPARRGRGDGRCGPARPGRLRRAAASASATTRSCSRACSRSRASRVAAAAWDTVERLRAAGSEPRPHAVGVRRGGARPLARRRSARRGHDRPQRR